MQTSLSFDAKQGEQRKERAMDLLSFSRPTTLGLARACAVSLANRSGTVTADDVFREMQLRYVDVSDLGKVAGALFRGYHWQFTGEWVKSQRVTNNARYIRVWRLRNA